MRGNEDASDVAKKHSDIRFWIVLNPRIKKTYKREESLLTHPHCKGIKIHPTEHAYEIRDYGDEIFEFTAVHKAIIICHSGYQGSFPEDFIPFVNRYKDVPLIIAHLGNSANGKVTRQVYALKRTNNNIVYIDTSSAKSMNSGLIDGAVSEVGTD